MWGTSSNFPSIASYAGAEITYDEIKPLRGSPDFRPLDTRSSRAKSQIIKHGDDYIIRLYSTDVVRYFANGEVFINCGGYETQATAAAISAMSPYVTWCQKGVIVIRMPDMKRYVVPREGLLIRADQPVNPVAASVTRTRVVKETAKQVREYFKDVPKMITVLTAMLAGKELPKRTSFTDLKRAYEIGEPLEEHQVTSLAMQFLTVSYNWTPSGTCKVVDNAAKSSIARFWKEAYKYLECIETYETALPLGEV